MRVGEVDRDEPAELKYPLVGNSTISSLSQKITQWTAWVRFHPQTQKAAPATFAQPF